MKKWLLTGILLGTAAIAGDLTQLYQGPGSTRLNGIQTLEFKVGGKGNSDNPFSTLPQFIVIFEYNRWQSVYEKIRIYDSNKNLVAESYISNYCNNGSGCTFGNFYVPRYAYYAGPFSFSDSNGNRYEVVFKRYSETSYSDPCTSSGSMRVEMSAYIYNSNNDLLPFRTVFNKTYSGYYIEGSPGYVYKEMSVIADPRVYLTLPANAILYSYQYSTDLCYE